jgi:dephospho-CoA kinase
MMTVGITGGIGSGKTIICQVFSQLGIAVYNADYEAKQMYNLPAVKEELKKKFGKKVLDKDENLDKKKMAELIFNDEKALEEINALIHPLVKQHFNDWKGKQEGEYILKEAAILFESGAYKDCDKIILVTAPAEIRVERVLKRDNRTRKEVEQIMAQQWSDEKRSKHSDFVITNDESQLVIPQVLEIHTKLMAEHLKDKFDITV